MPRGGLPPARMRMMKLKGERQMENGVVLSMRQICKSFPGVKALQNVDFTLRKGEIHALMGENGAGKSTLIKVLTGVYSRDAGTVNIDGVAGDVAIRYLPPIYPGKLTKEEQSVLHETVRQQIIDAMEESRNPEVEWKERI